MESLDTVIDPSWARALAPVEGKIHELGAQLRREIEAGHGYLPAGSDVLRAFTYPLDQVKVLIVGQDPYPTPGHAIGLSFSVAPGIPFPASLRNIFKGYIREPTASGRNFVGARRAISARAIGIHASHRVCAPLSPVSAPRLLWLAPLLSCKYSAREAGRNASGLEIAVDFAVRDTYNKQGCARA